MRGLVLVEKIAGTQDGVITATQCLESGLSRGQIRTLCRRKQFRRLFWGTYLVNADLFGQPTARSRIRAALLSSGRSGVAILDSAAALLGIAGASPGDQPVHVAHPPEMGRRQRLVDRDLHFHQIAVAETDLTVIDGMRVTTAIRTVADLLLRLDRMSAVATVDSALSRGLLLPGDVDEVRGLLVGRRRAASAAGWLEEVDGRAESPLETRSRLRCVDGGVAPDDLQVEIFDDYGNFIGRVDMLWRRGRIVGEADGAEYHDRPAALFRDRQRQNALVVAGYKVIRFTWQDTQNPGDIPAMVRAALTSAPPRS